MCIRRFIHLVIASLVMALAVAPAAAAPPDRSVTRTTSLFLGAYSPEAGISVSVFRSPDGYQVCVSTPTGSGCALVDEDAVQLDTKYLTSATLGPVTVQLQQCDEHGCSPGEEVTVAIAFTGTGELTKFKGHWKTSNGCQTMSSSKGLYREGDATITLDGTPYDAQGFLSTSLDTFKVMCRH